MADDKLLLIDLSLDEEDALRRMADAQGLSAEELAIQIIAARLEHLREVERRAEGK